MATRIFFSLLYLIFLDMKSLRPMPSHFSMLFFVYWWSAEANAPKDSANLDYEGAKYGLLPCRDLLSRQ